MEKYGKYNTNRVLYNIQAADLCGDKNTIRVRTRAERAQVRTSSAQDSICMEKFVPKSARGANIRYFAVSAHKDDVEMFAFDGIARGFDGGGFAAAVLTDGGQCPRAGAYAAVDDEDMSLLRTAEQKRAAEVGRYEALYLFEKSSAEVKHEAKNGGETVKALAEIFRENPRIDTLYLHNPFDSHPTHVAAFAVAIAAVKMLKDDEKPRKIFGCEVWRDLDWLSDCDKIAMNVSGYEELSAKLMSCFASQNAVKRYDIAAAARRKANATFYQSHEGDEATALVYGLDLTPLAYDMALGDFIEEKIGNFRRDIHRFDL